MSFLHKSDETRPTFAGCNAGAYPPRVDGEQGRLAGATGRNSHVSRRHIISSRDATECGWVTAPRNSAKNHFFSRFSLDLY